MQYLKVAEKSQGAMLSWYPAKKYMEHCFFFERSSESELSDKQVYKIVLQYKEHVPSTNNWEKKAKQSLIPNIIPDMQVNTEHVQLEWRFMRGT